MKKINNFIKQLRLIPLLLLMTLLPFGLASAAEQDTTASNVEVPAALGPEAMTSLVSKLDAEQTDALVELMELLNTAAPDQARQQAEETDTMLATLEQWVLGFGQTLVNHLYQIPQMVMGAGQAIASPFTGRDIGGNLVFLVLLVLVIGIARAAEWAFNRLFPQRHTLVPAHSPDGLLDTLKTLSIRGLIQIVDVIVFAIVFAIAASILFNDPNDRVLLLGVLKAILIIRLSAAMLLFVLAPKRADLRLVSTDNQTANMLYRHLVSVAILVGVALFILALMTSNNIDGAGSFRFFVGLTVVLWLMYLTWITREGLTSIIIGGDQALTPGLEIMASWWPKISIAIIALNWLIIQFVISTGSEIITPVRGALSLALIIILPFLDTMVRGISAHLVPPMEGSGAIAEKAHEQSRHSYVRIGRIFLFAIVVLLLANILGLNLRELAASGLGAEIASHALGFLLILAGGYLTMEVISLWINRKLARELPDAESESEEGGAGLSRMATILPILHMTLNATVVMLTVLLALSQLGVNIAPLLAGAGVLGLAIGFGAQTLVKDIVSGVFFLLDDAFRKGEYVDVGGMLGTVEKISIRSLQLRDAKGPIHIVPYGSISKLTNMSRDWVIVKLKFVVPFDTDLEKVRKLFKKIGQQIMEVPEYADDLLAPFKSQGAADVTDVGIVVRGKFTAKPGGQWMVKRQIYSRVQKAFEENGIEFARKEVRVTMPDADNGAELSAETKAAIGAAASEAAQPPVTR